MNKTQKKKIGLALGGGGARGCAHVGVIKALEKAGVEISFVAGTSIGALVGGIYAAGHLKELEDFLRKIKWHDVARQFDPTVRRNGMFKGEKVMKLVDQLIGGKTFKDCEKLFVAVATDFLTGKEVRLNEGQLSSAIRASISLPGIFTTVEHKGMQLLDGGIVNPLPVNVVRQMGADIVIAIDLNKEFVQERKERKRQHRDGYKKLNQWLRSPFPNMVDVLEGSVFLMQQAITEKNLETDPADFLLNLNLGSSSVFDFHRAKELIKKGEQQMEDKMGALRKVA
ncbi:MAG: patatin-like phospholipase family protein [Candidatus Peregrinibacteria bacterium]|nr:patatin-like phospholipase family protein [Candidatus Peregrinibacteria bacterium]